MAPQSSTLAWKIPWTEEPGRLQSMGSLRVRYNWTTSLSLFTFMHWRRKWQPTPVFLPGESQEWEPGGLLSMGSHRVGHDWSDLAAAACRWHHPYGRKWRRTKEPVNESERGEWKSWLKAQHSENEDHGIWSHHFMANRQGNNGNSGWLYFGTPKSLQMVIAAMKLKDAYSLEGKFWPT